MVSFKAHPSWRDRKHNNFAACKSLIQEHKPLLCMCHRNCAILGRFHILREFYEFLGSSKNFWSTKKLENHVFTGKLLI